MAVCVATKENFDELTGSGYTVADFYGSHAALFPRRQGRSSVQGLYGPSGFESSDCEAAVLKEAFSWAGFD